MTETMFCYCCRVHHPKDQLRPSAPNPGLRGPCLRSIEPAAGNLAKRDAFGQQQSKINREDSRRIAERTPMMHLDRDPRP